MRNGPRTLLHRRHRLALWKRPLWIAVAALGCDVVLTQFGAELKTRAWLLAVALVAAVVARLFIRPSLNDTARVLDARTGARNRFEALAAFEGRADPLAKAIEGETAVHLERQPLPHPYAWAAGLVLLFILATSQIATLDVVGQKAPAQPAVHEQPEEKLAGPAASLPPTPMPVVSLRWIEPKPGITATSTEVVPLLAESDCLVGLTKLRLQLTRSGESLAPVPQSVNGAAGVQSIPLMLDLAAVDCPPFAFVTYHLVAERVRSHVTEATPPWPDVVSPLQLVQIRPVGSTLTLDPPPSDEAAESEAERLLFGLKRLKLAQMEALKEIFAVDRSTALRADSEWLNKVQAAAAGERTIWQTANALIPLFEKTISASFALEPLRQAQAEIQKAWDELARSDTAAAFASADRGLARVAEAERILTDVVEQLRREKTAALAASSQDGSELPPRGDTPAGRLEALALQQQELADELARGTAADAFARQNRIVLALAPLAREPGFPPAVAAAIEAAAADANEATGHLNDRDPHAATEPATRAAQTLQAAVAALDADGKVAALAELAKAQRAFIHAAVEVLEGKTAAAAQEVVAIRKELREEAARQQKFGSAVAAEQLGDLGATIERSKVEKELNDLLEKLITTANEEREAAARKLIELAQNAANARKNLQTDEERESAMAKLTEELKRMQANAERAADQGEEAMRDLFEQAQIAAQQADASLSLPSSSSDNDGEDGAGSGAEQVKWKPGMDYPAGTNLVYNGILFRCLRDHRSREGLEPTNAPQLWKIEKSQGTGSDESSDKPTWMPRQNYLRRAEVVYKDMVFSCLEEHVSAVGLEPPNAPRLWHWEAKKSASQSAGHLARQASGRSPGGAPGSGGKTESINRQRYGRDLSREIDRIVKRLVAEERRTTRAQVLTTATPGEAPPDYRAAVANYFEALTRDGGKKTAAPAPSTP